MWRGKMLLIYKCIQCHHPCVLIMEDYTEPDGPDAETPTTCPIGGDTAKWEKI